MGFGWCAFHVVHPRSKSHLGVIQCVQGYFIKATSLPRFWYYWAHWIVSSASINVSFQQDWCYFYLQDFQTFSFQLIVRNDVKGLTFQCPTIDGSCLCPFASSLVPAQCALTGDDIVKVSLTICNYQLHAIEQETILFQNLGYEGANDGLYVGVLIIIVVFYRMAMWGVLAIRKR